VLGTTTLAGGTAEFLVAALPIGSHAFRARYEGDAGFAASNSPKRTVTVDPRIGTIIPVDSDSDPEQADYSKDYPAVTGFGGGGFAAVWQSTAPGGHSARVYARRYKPGGEPLDDEFRVGAAVGTSQWRPAIATLSGGAYLVVWEASGPDGRAVHGQRYRNASPVGDPFRIGTGGGGVALGRAPMNGAPDRTATPAVAALADGGFVVVWVSDRQDDTGRNVYARRYGANAQPLGEEFRVHRTTANDQWQPAVAALGDGGFVVTWSSNETDPAITGVFGQRYDAAAQKAGKMFRVMALSQHRDEPSVAGLAGNDFVVAYSAEHQNIQARRYDSVGALGDAFRVDTARDQYQYAPRVTRFTEHGFIVIWTLDNGSGSEIHARLYTIGGKSLSGSFRIDEAAPDVAAEMPSVARLVDGRVVVVWQSRNLITQQTRIQAQRLNLSGAILAVD